MLHNDNVSMSVRHLDHVLIVYSSMEHVTGKSSDLVHLKDKVKDEEKTELIYHVPCKNCSSSYVGETGRKFSLRIKEHKKEVDSFTCTQTRASRAR